MRLVVCLLSVFLCWNLAAKTYVDIHYAILESDPLKKLIDSESQVLPPLKAQLEQIAASKNIIVRTKTESTKYDLISSLRDPEVLGVIWVGHNKPNLTGEGAQAKIYNSHLVDVNKSYLVKDVFSAAHQNLKFLSLNTCYLADMIPRYHLNASFPFDVIIPGNESLLNPSTPVNAVSDYRPLEDGVNVILGMEEVYQKVIAKIKQLDTASDVPVSQTQRIEIEISYQDLLSFSYDYEVMVDSRLANVLDVPIKMIGTQKIKLPSGNKKFALDLEKGHHVIVIAPNDPNRIAYEYKHPIDNIIISKVSVKDVSGMRDLLNYPVNIGDEDVLDQEISLASDVNKPQLSSLPPLKELRLEFDL